MNFYTDALEVAAMTGAIVCGLVIFAFLVAGRIGRVASAAGDATRRAVTDLGLALAVTLAGTLVLATAGRPHGPLSPAADWTLITVGAAVAVTLYGRLRGRRGRYHSHR